MKFEAMQIFIRLTMLGEIKRFLCEINFVTLWKNGTFYKYMIQTLKDA